MDKSNTTMHDTFTLGAMQAHFTAALPEMRNTIAFTLRGVYPADRREELIQNALALAWQSVLSLAKRGRDYRDFWTTLAWRAAQASKNGRSIVGRESLRDAMTWANQISRGYTSEALPEEPGHAYHEWPDGIDAFWDDDAPADTACLLADLPAWVQTLTHRQRQVLRLALADESGLDIARRLGISPGRVSQIRSGLADSWVVFTA